MFGRILRSSTHANNNNNNPAAGGSGGGGGGGANRETANNNNNNPVAGGNGNSANQETPNNNNNNNAAAGVDHPAPNNPAAGVAQPAPIDRRFQEAHDPNPYPLYPRPTRRYGEKPRGVVLRVRDPPGWTRTLQGKTVLREMNRQGIFDQEINQAYNVVPPETMATRFRRFCNTCYNASNMFLKIEFALILFLLIYIGIMYVYLHKAVPVYFFITE